jgi:hypothetical protein
MKKGKKFIALFLVFSLLTLSGNLYAKKKGAELIIQKKDRGQIRGELITVKPNSLLLLDTEGKDVSVDIADIKIIRIVKKSEVWKGIQIGGFIGAVAGALLFIASEKDKVGSLPIAMFTSPAIQSGAIGASIGGMVGVAVADKKTQIEGMTGSEIKEALDKLRKKARIRDYKQGRASDSKTKFLSIKR